MAYKDLQDSIKHLALGVEKIDDIEMTKDIKELVTRRWTQYDI